MHAETPIRVEYSLTEKGLALRAVFAAIGQWTRTYLDSDLPEQRTED